MKWPRFCAIYFILIRDFRAELVQSHASFHKMRQLEIELWTNYLRSLNCTSPEHMLLYHWRVKANPETIDDFIALASFKTVRHRITDYILGILLLGIAASATESVVSLALAFQQPLYGHLVTLLGGIAEFERDLIRARTSEGRARAKARGVHVGRPPASSFASARKSCVTSPRARRRRPTSRGGSMRAELRFHDWHMPKFDIHSQEERCVV